MTTPFSRTRQRCSSRSTWRSGSTRRANSVTPTRGPSGASSSRPASRGTDKPVGPFARGPVMGEVDRRPRAPDTDDGPPQSRNPLRRLVLPREIAPIQPRRPCVRPLRGRPGHRRAEVFVLVPGVYCLIVVDCTSTYVEVLLLLTPKLRTTNRISFQDPSARGPQTGRKMPRLAAWPAVTAPACGFMSTSC